MATIERNSKNKKFWTNKIHDVLISVESSGLIQDSASAGILLPIKGGAEYGQFCYISSFKSDKIRIHSGAIKPDEIVLEIHGYKVAGCTWHDVQLLFKELIVSHPTLSLKLVKTGASSNDLAKELRPFLSQRFGKDTIEYMLQSEVRENLYMRTVPCTTRQPRPGEVNGIDYWFVSVDEFLAKDKNGELLESGVYEGNYYGTPRPPKDALQNGIALASSLKRASPLENGGYINRNGHSNGDEHPVVITSSSPTVRFENGESNGHHARNTTTTDDRNGEEQLPDGWERVDDPHYGVYYIDHINKRTQYDKPTTAATSSDVPDVNNANGSVAALSPQQQASTESAKLPQQQIQQHQPLPQQQPQVPTMTLVQPGIRYLTQPSGATFFTTDPSQLRGEFITSRLAKSATGFGFTIVGGDNTNEEFLQVKSIIPNGSADVDGKLRTGDVLVSVNHTLTLGYSHADAVKLFQTIPIGALADIEVCRGYPLPFDPNDPSMEYLTTVAVSQQQPQVVPNHQASPSTHQLQQQQQPQPVVYHTIPIIKGPSGFGFTITSSSSGQRVKQILDRPRCRTLLEGDLLCEINSHPVSTIPHPDVVNILKNCPTGQEAIIVVKRNSPTFHSPPISSSSLLQKTQASNSGHVNQSSVMTRSFTAGEVLSADPQLPVTHTTSEGFLIREESRVPEVQQPQQQQHQQHNHQLQPQQQQHQQHHQQPQQQQHHQQQQPQQQLLEHPQQSYYSQQQLQRSRTPGPDMRSANVPVNGSYSTAAALVDDSQRVQQMMAMNQSFHAAMAGLSMQSNGGQRNYTPSLHSPPIQLPYQEFSISLRRLESGFGFRLIGGREESSQISIGHVVEDGAAALDGRLRTGDEIVAIDGTPLLGASHQLAVKLMSEASQRGIVLLSLRRRFDPGPQAALHLSLPRQSTLKNGGALSAMASPRIATSLSPPTPPQPLQAATIALSRSEEEGFGFVVVSSVNRSGSSIGHIIENSPAARCGQLRIGDRILAINGIDTSTLSHGDVINLIKESGQNLRLTILPSGHADGQFGSPNTNSQQHVMAPAPLESTMPYQTSTLARPNFAPVPSQLSPANGNAFELVAVELHRGARGFGFSIRGGREFAMPLYVLRIADGGAAAIDGRLQVGDEILEINNQSALGMTHAQAIDLIQSAGSALVRLVVRRFRKTDA